MHEPPEPPPPLTSEQRERLRHLIVEYEAEHGRLPPPEWTDEQLRRIREEADDG